MDLRGNSDEDHSFRAGREGRRGGAGAGWQAARGKGASMAGGRESGRVRPTHGRVGRAGWQAG